MDGITIALITVVGIVIGVLIGRQSQATVVNNHYYQHDDVNVEIDKEGNEVDESDEWGVES